MGIETIQQHMECLLKEMVDQGKERGAQLAVYYRGELIVNAWAGVADIHTGRAVARDTLFPVFSVTKGIAATVIHLLAERHKLDYDMKISEVWPEFRANSKDGCTIRHVLNHTSGIPQMPAGLDAGALTDWSKMTDEISKLAPLWPPGEHMEYHAITFGWIIGEFARRVEGRTFAEIVQEDICRPLGITDLYVGIPETVEPRVAVLEEPEVDCLNVDLNETSPIPSWIWPLSEWMNGSEARRACVPASNGIMSAHAIARHYAALIPGGVDGVELLPPARVKMATEQFRLKDGTNTGRSLGYHNGAVDPVLGSRPTVFGHGGYGGSIGFADPDNALAVGYTHNLLLNNASAREAIIGQLKSKLDILD